MIKEINGFGVYLGSGIVLTAAHVVGHYPLITHPRVQVAGLDLPAEVIKKGSANDTDLALLSIDESALPASLQLRRNPLCKALPPPGANVLVLYPERSVATYILSPAYIAPQMRQRFYSLIDEQEGSGAGVFDAERRCLLGIISQRIPKLGLPAAQRLTSYSGCRLGGIFCAGVGNQGLHPVRRALVIPIGFVLPK